MRNKKPWVFGALAFGVALAAYFYFSHPAQPTDQKKSLAIGYSRLRISLPIFVAKERGLFQSHGIDVDLQQYDTAQPMAAALSEGKIQIAGYTAMPITYSAMLRSGKKFIFITTMIEDPKHRISYLLRKKPASPDEKPAIRTIADLRGKRIGILPTTAYKSWLEVILKSEGIAPADVTIQQVEPQLQPQLLASGGVDALFTNDPPATAAIEKGIAELINASDVECPRVMGDPFPFASFNVTKEWADANPAVLQQLVAALDEAIEYINAHPKESNLLMRAYLPDVFKPNVDKYPEARYLTSKESSEKMFSDLAAEYKRLGIIPQDVDLSGLVYKPKSAP